MILAAGLGTRLRPLTHEVPKPLVPIGDCPALVRVLARVRAAKPSRIVVNAHHFAPALEAALAGQPSLAVSREAELLGTAGGVAHAADLLGPGDVLVWNADVLADVDAAALVAAHELAGADATLAVRIVGEAGQGNVGLDHADRIVRLREESFAPGEVRGADFLGIHVIGASLRAKLPERGCLIGDLYLPRGHVGAELVAFVTDAPFVDVGSLRGYLEANFAWLKARGERDHVRGATAPGVQIGDDVIVPEDARIEGEGLVERVVVWPGATAHAPLSDAVVTPRAVVPVPRRAPV